MKKSVMTRVLGWIACALVGGAGLSALVAVLPGEIRKLLLLPLAFGLATGWGVKRLAAAFEIRGVRTRAVLAGVVCLLGLLNIGRISYARMQIAAAANVEQDPKQLLSLDLLASQADEDDGWTRRYLEERMRLRPTFQDYLAGRLTQLAIWRPPWPLVVWISELSIGSLAAAWMAARSIQAASESESEGLGET